jgi:hypothetical protein
MYHPTAAAHPLRAVTLTTAAKSSGERGVRGQGARAPHRLGGRYYQEAGQTVACAPGHVRGGHRRLAVVCCPNHHEFVLLKKMRNKFLFQSGRVSDARATRQGRGHGHGAARRRGEAAQPTPEVTHTDGGPDAVPGTQTGPRGSTRRAARYARPPPPRGAHPRETEWTWWAHTRRWKRPCLQTAHIAI